MNLYAQKLEALIAEMKDAEEISALDRWLEFLKEIYPESALLQPNETPDVEDSPNEGFAATSHNLPSQEYTDIRKIILLAESAGYPIWYIQPKLLGLNLSLRYQKDELTEVTFHDEDRTEVLDMILAETIPKRIKGFTGRISGTLHMTKEQYEKYGARDDPGCQIAVYEAYESGNLEQLRFIATDTDSKLNFQEKMVWLQSNGFLASSYVLFPTDRLSSIPSSQLELFFENYLTKIQEQGYLADGLLIISDTPIIQDSSFDPFRIIYKPLTNQLSI